MKRLRVNPFRSNHHFVVSPATESAGITNPSLARPTSSAPGSPTPIAGSEVGRLEAAQLISLFELHGGFLPATELLAEGFHIGSLVERGLIVQSRNHLDFGCYLIGESLRKHLQHV
jgi:hypothetical protein